MPPADVHVETTRRLTTLTGAAPPVVWDARVVDGMGRVLSACDHGHATAAQAVDCGQGQAATLR